MTQNKLSNANMNERDAAYITKIATIADRDGIQKIKDEYNKVWSQIDEARKDFENTTVLDRKMDSLEFVLVASGVQY